VALLAERRARRIEDARTFEIEMPGDTLRDRAMELVKQVREDAIAVPMLPAAATRVLTIANDPSASVQEVARVVERDPLLAARILAVANSARYGTTRVGSLKNALARLGSGTVRDVLYEAVAQAHIFRGPAGSGLAAELEHAVGVARTAQVVCERLGIPSEHAFVCGLLHDIGRPIIVGLVTKMREPPAEMQRLVDAAHARVGAEVAKRWALPKVVADVCLHHHHDADTSGYSQFANIVAVADRIARHLGIGRRVTAIDLTRDRCFFDLGLDRDRVMELVRATAELDLRVAA
jgi:putative nucleotidyltransferase with HDIG domain